MVRLERRIWAAAAAADPPVTGAGQTELISAQLAATAGPVWRYSRLCRTYWLCQLPQTGALAIDPRRVFSLRLSSSGTHPRTT